MFAAICALSELEEGELYRFDIAEKALLVIKFNKAIFVTDSICTHEEADLSLGMFADGIVTCPLHRARFRMQDGTVLSGPDGGSAEEISKLKVYPTKIENGVLFADL